jgi:tetratricopeptide (TPR) repeat protein
MPVEPGVTEAGAAPIQGVAGRITVDAVLVAAIIITVLAFIGRTWLANVRSSNQVAAMAGTRNAASEGFKYETNEGLRYYQTKEYAKAENAFRKSIQYSPGDALGYNNLGSVLNNQKKWDEAIRVLSRAVELNPALQIARNNLAWAQSHKVLDARGRGK